MEAWGNARPFFRCIFLFICLTNAVACFAIFTYTLTIVDFANDNGFSHYNAAMIMTAMSVGWGGASLSMAPIVDSGITSKETVIFSSFVIQGSGLVLMALLKTSYLWLVASGFMIGWGQGSRGFLPFVLLSETFKKRQTPVAFALMSVSCAVPFLARAPIIGYVRDTLGSYDVLMLTLAVIESVFAFFWGVLAFCKWRKKRAKFCVTAPLVLQHESAPRTK
ncbi:monocarboxylate transporter 12-B-like [Ixodes scapularis]|uniref:monocarboxylate transporter 12-B-like n=1 Tax=Ixodes scapularis TaxID=6945 RepID=UPI001C38441F|nr:monocarboxylate transporter 12-B-like [Ixodes scapularis]